MRQGLFVDGVLTDTQHWIYPPSQTAQPLTYTIGSDHEDASLRWCVASMYLLSTPMGNDLPRLIHHLGTRYNGNFQDKTMVRFLTYEAST